MCTSTLRSLYIQANLNAGQFGYHKGDDIEQKAGDAFDNYFGYTEADDLTQSIDDMRRSITTMRINLLADNADPIELLIGNPDKYADSTYEELKSVVDSIVDTTTQVSHEDSIALPTGYPDEAWDHALSSQGSLIHEAVEEAIAEEQDTSFTQADEDEAYDFFFNELPDSEFEGTETTRQQAFDSYVGYRKAVEVNKPLAELQLALAGPLSFLETAE